MNAFLSYASEDRALAERICRVLEAEGCDVFFDRDDLGAGDVFGARIREAIAAADVLVFLISRASITSPSYALTELAVALDLGARRRPAIVPVRIDATAIDAVPAALRSITILEPLGDVPAEVAHAVQRIAQRHSRRRRLRVGGGIGAAVAVGAVSWFLYWPTGPGPTAPPGAPPVASGPAPSKAVPWLNESLASAAAAASAAQAAAAAAAAPSDPIETLNQAMLRRVPPERRVTLSGMPGNDGWSALLVLADRSVSAIQVRVDDGPFRSTGTTEFANALTGQPQPNTTVRLPGAFWDRHAVVVKYTDYKGREHGPFNLTFDPREQFLRFAKQALDNVPWVALQHGERGERLAYFTTLVSYRAAIREIRYSLDNVALDRQWPLTATATRQWPARLDDEVIYVPVPAATRFVTVRVTYSDGSADTRRFDVAR